MNKGSEKEELQRMNEEIEGWADEEELWSVHEFDVFPLFGWVTKDLI